MSAFLPAYNRTLEFEGKTLETVEGDPGGMTFWGISRRFNTTWPGWAFIDSVGPTAEELPELVLDFYEKNYWFKNNLDKINSEQLACQLYDAIVNLGSVSVAKGLETILGTEVDGSIGPKDVNACNMEAENYLVVAFIVWRKNFYQTLVKINPEKSKFLDGWLSRCTPANLA